MLIFNGKFLLCGLFKQNFYSDKRTTLKILEELHLIFVIFPVKFYLKTANLESLIDTCHFLIRYLFYLCLLFHYRGYVPKTASFYLFVVVIVCSSQIQVNLCG